MVENINDINKEVNEDFRVSTRDGKYTAIFYKPSGWEVRRHGEPWISRDETVSLIGTNAWHAFIWELAEIRNGDGIGDGPTPMELARQTLTSAKLPKDPADVAKLAPIPEDLVLKLIALSITRDRNSHPLNPTTIAERVLANAGMFDAELLDEDLTRKIRNYMIAGLRAGQARGARMGGRSISEDDYAEASRAGHEAFMATLKDKGLWG